MFRDMNLVDYTNVLSSANPTPGGGSASAVTIAMGIGLIEMAIQLTKDKKKYASHLDLYEQSLQKLSYFRNEATQDIDRDGEAFAAFMKIYKEKPTQEGQEDHCKRLHDALDKAGRVPLHMAKQGVNALAIAIEVANHINPFVISDLIGGVELINGGIRSALLNVAINVNSMTLPLLKDSLQADMEEVKVESHHHYQLLKQQLYEYSDFSSLA